MLLAFSRTDAGTRSLLLVTDANTAQLKMKTIKNNIRLIECMVSLLTWRSEVNLNKKRKWESGAEVPVECWGGVWCRWHKKLYQITF